MKNKSSESSNKSLGISLILISGFLVIAFISVLIASQSSKITQSDSALAGSREAVDSTVKPSEMPVLEDPSVSAKPTNLASPTASIKTSLSPKPTKSPQTSARVSPSGSPLVFISAVVTSTPTPTPPPFDIQIPSDDQPIIEPTPIPTASPATSNNNTPLIIGGAVGTIVLILLIVGIILLRKSKDNTPPPMMPQTPFNNGNGNTDPNNTPQYPPYINQ